MVLYAPVRGEWFPEIKGMQRDFYVFPKLNGSHLLLLRGHMEEMMIDEFRGDRGFRK